VVSRTERVDAEFSEFVAARSTQLYRNAYLLTTSSHAAEDLVQSALAKAYAAWWRVRRADDPVSYVHGILIKTFLSERRRRSSHEVAVAEVSDGSTTTGDPTDRLDLLDALRALNDLDRAVVVLRFWEDRSVAQTAGLLGLTEAAVKNRCLRALKALRVRLVVPMTHQRSLPDKTTKWSAS
jgi:RNA polymerase sigma-70 factor (sigma-E family)